MQIAVDKIREVIGSGGKVIRSIVEESGAKVDINDDGTIKIASANASAIEKARELIAAIVDEPEVGRVYTGKVVKIMDFGAFVNFFGKRDGLVHVSQLSNERVGHPKELAPGGPEREGQADGLRRARQGPPVDEGRRPGDRQGSRQRERDRRLRLTLPGTAKAPPRAGPFLLWRAFARGRTASAVAVNLSARATWMAYALCIGLCIMRASSL